MLISIYLLVVDMNHIIDSRVDLEMKSLIADLQVLIRQPSVSAKNQGLIECAKLVLDIMRKAGIDAEILYLYSDKDKDKDKDENENENNKIKAKEETNKYNERVPPILYGEVKSKSNPHGKTILFYNHYDVQPEEPIELWESEPFSGKVKGNYIFGRGSADDKGELITRIKAVEYYLKETSDVPCNVKFIIEGEEEIGSTNLENYLFHYKKRIGKCDTVIWESGTIDEKDRAIIELGVKGILSVELFAKGPSIYANSSLAVLIENPAWILVRALNTILDYNNNEKIMIDDWYKEVREFTT